MERTFTAHVEKSDGSYSNFEISAPTVWEAYALAQESLDDNFDTLQGITPNE